MRLLDEKVRLCFLRGASVHETVERIRKKFAGQAARMIRTAEYHYRQAGWHWVMEAFSDMDPKKQTFTFSGGSCDDCASLNGESFTQDEIESQGIVPPFHPNCGCVLVPDRVAQAPENATCRF